MLGNSRLLRFCHGQKFLNQFEVLVENLKRVVDRAVRAKTKHAVDRVSQRASVTHHLSLKVLFAVLANRRWLTAHFHAESDSKSAAGPMVELQRFQVLQQGSGDFSHHHRLGILDLCFGEELV